MSYGLEVGSPILTIFTNAENCGCNYITTAIHAHNSTLLYTWPIDGCHIMLVACAVACLRAKTRQLLPEHAVLLCLVSVVFTFESMATHVIMRLIRCHSRQTYISGKLCKTHFECLGYYSVFRRPYVVKERGRVCHNTKPLIGYRNLTWSILGLGIGLGFWFRSDSLRCWNLLAVVEAAKPVDPNIESGGDSVHGLRFKHNFIADVVETVAPSTVYIEIKDTKR